MFVPRTVTRRGEQGKRQPPPHLAKPDPTSSERKLKVVVEDFRSKESATTTDTPTTSTEEDEEVVLFSRFQRWPVPGEPICLECGRYGAYIIDKTDEDICSRECKANRLKKLGIIDEQESEGGCGFSECGRGFSEGGEEGEGWRYREHPEVASWSKEHVLKMRKELELMVIGARVPRPVSSLDHIPFPHPVLRGNVEDYSRLTVVQRQTIPAALTGRDLLVQATTGAGKSFSFLLPLVIRILYETTPTQREGAGPRAVVLTPTRELSMQLERQAQQIMKGIPSMKTALVVGGLSVSNQIYRLKSGVQIVIATPARLLDILETRSTEVDVSCVEFLVLDEVDSLLQLGFEGQVLGVEERLPAVRQKMFFSATVPPRIEKMASDLLQDPLRILVGEVNSATDRVRHTVLWVEEKAKKKRLFALLNDPSVFKPPVIIFVNSKAGTLLLAEAINKRCPHVATVGIHGDMAQERRSQILAGFLEEKYSAVVATGVLARGLDLKNVQQVFVFDMPSSIAEFVHQCVTVGVRLGGQVASIEKARHFHSLMPTTKVCFWI
ncbi:Probable ATP-dependent RNA helicase DDX59 [Geodia barretti]|nr:Probable ATP-dependent RNA helicase DDX59 [Geodia barretti]